MNVSNLVFYQEMVIPQEWLLGDLLHWVAFQRLPEAFYDEYGREKRSNLGPMEEIELDENDSLMPFFTKSETERAALPIDPRHKYYAVDDDRIDEPKFFEQMLEVYNLDDVEKDKIRAQLLNVKELAQDKIVFDEILENYLDEYYSKIHLALKTGDLTATGIQFESIDEEEILDTIFSMTNEDKISQVQEIEKSEWVLKNIDWERGLLQTRSKTTTRIRFKSLDVLELFPPTFNKTDDLFRYGDVYFSSEKGGSKIIKSKRGRRPYNWELFHAAVAEQIFLRKLPKKQDAAAAYFQNWLDSEHSFKPGLSTIKAKLKPYYKSVYWQKSSK